MDWKEEFIEKLFPIDEKKLNIDAAYAIKDQHLPMNIYKYRTVNSYSLKNFEEDNIWLSSPQSFNDPYDCSFNINFRELIEKGLNKEIDDVINNVKVKQHLTKESIKIIKNSDNPFETLQDILLKAYPQKEQYPIKNTISIIINKFVDDLLKNSNENMKNNFKLCSFSERNDSILMWSHYSKQHKGFCIEYDISKLKYSDFRRRFLYPVLYSNNMLDASKYFEGFTQGDHNILYLTLAALMKAIDWQYEKEWRLIFSHGILSKDQPYYMGPAKSILLGARIESSDENKITEIAKRKNIPVYKMKLINGKFKLTPENISL